MFSKSPRLWPSISGCVQSRIKGSHADQAISLRLDDRRTPDADGTGSDLQGVRTQALKAGHTYRINGSKTFITHGGLAFKLAECQAALMACRPMVDECLQPFGGHGHMKEYPIARLWTDARVQRIYGGTHEIMKELASRFL
jgi:alkylation response protein AidB-like acyl-CoA dehydrogenase